MRTMTVVIDEADPDPDYVSYLNEVLKKYGGIDNIDLTRPIVFKFDYSIWATVKNVTLTYNNNQGEKIVSHPLPNNVIYDLNEYCK